MRKDFPRPDADAIRRVLEQVKNELAEVIIRLAWECGLSREEIQHLRWTEVAFDEKQITLSDRRIPLEETVLSCLEHRWQSRGRFSEYVVHSDRQRLPLQPPSISRIVRTALDAEECLKGITLRDLKHDYIRRMLSKHDWPYVARISGMAATTMMSLFADYLENSRANQASDVKPDEFFVWKLVQSEGNSAEGLAVWMAWKHSMEVNEIIGLTWDQVDLHSGTIQLSDRQIVMDGLLKRRLQAVLADRTPEDDPHVLLTPKSRRPYEHARLSNATRTVFIRSGAENMTLRDLVLGSKRGSRDNQVLDLIDRNGPSSREEIVTHFGISASTAYHLLHRLVEEGALVRIGQKYYLAEKVVPPEKHYEVIRGYLETVRSAFRQEFVELLHVEPLQCTYLLGQLVKEGKLVQTGQRYSLPEERG